MGVEPLTGRLIAEIELNFRLELQPEVSACCCALHMVRRGEASVEQSTII